MKELKQIQSQVFRVGLHQNKDALNKLMVFCTNPSSGNLQYAERIFSYIQYPYLFIYNLMIRAFGTKGHLSKAILLFGRLREDGLSPDNFTYPFVLKAIGCLQLMEQESSERPDEATVVSTLSACVALKNLELGMEIHNYISKELDFTTILGNALLDIYVNCGQLDDAREMFEKSPTRDVVLWTAMINGYVQFNHFDEAMSLFRERQIRRFKPDRFTVVCLLTGSAQLGALEQGKWIHGYIKENMIMMDAIVCTALIDMYAKCGCIQNSMEIFEGIEVKDTTSWTAIICAAIICGLAINGQTNKALQFFSEMKRVGTKPDDVTFNGRNDGGEDTANLRMAIGHVFCTRRRSVVPAVLRIEVIIVLRVMDWSISTEGLILHLLRLNSCILLLCRKFFSPTDEVTRSEAVGMEFPLGEELEVQGGGQPPSPIGPSPVLPEAPAETASADLAIEPKLEHYGCLVDLLCCAGLLDEAEEIHGNVEMGERVAKHIDGFESNNSGVHTLLSNIYAAANRWGDVTKVRRKMKDLGVKKLPRCNLIEVNGIVHEFLVGGASHPEIRKIFSMLDDIARPVFRLGRNVPDRVDPILR
ncbi:hypothetical protein HHK36_025725 [Tetracentron sinense]|uniref:Pentatricopeptide repeat-containing protein n=1 Tax=Tetracentron sinense TaxID=13715 RepID=A0A834YLS7_TETSI|nr:hypothetical protein HHK36_025725 [Tetracentron sinense]